MIKKRLIDILCIGLFAMIALLAAEKPVIDLSIRPSIPIPDKRQQRDATIKEETKKVEKEIVRDIVAFKSLKERNIFTPDGSYTTSKTLLAGPLPENPYTLIATLHGEEKKAVFRDYTGSVITLTVGKKLGDGSIITRIDNLSVEVKKGKEKRELKIFDIKVPRLSIGKKP